MTTASAPSSARYGVSATTAAIGSPTKRARAPASTGRSTRIAPGRARSGVSAGTPSSSSAPKARRTPGRRHSRGHVDAADMRVRMLGAREGEMQHALDGNVVEEPRAALEQNPVLHPRHPLADLPRKVGGRWARQGPTLYLWVHG